MDILIYAFVFYLGGAASLFQICSVGIGKNRHLPFLVRVWVGITWPFAAYMWTAEEEYPANDNDEDSSGDAG